MEPFLNQSMVQSLQMRQEQIMAPQQIQSLQILLATVPELEQRIEVELAENPTLEVLDHGSEELVGNPVEDNGSHPDGDHAAEAIEHDESLAALIQLDETWHDHAPSRNRGSSADEQERHQYLMNSLTAEPTFQELLLDQLRETENLDPATEEICRHVVGSIDETGYLRTGLADIALSLGADIERVEAALRVVQAFEPPGIGARDLRECLLIQLEREGRKGTKVYELVSKHLDAIGRNQIPRVARTMNISTGELYELLRDVKRLQPFPGGLVSPGSVEYVYPEVFVEKDGDGEWQIRSNRDYIPRLRISPYYLEMLENPETPKEVKTYIREKLVDSRLLMRAIDNRQSTIERIADSLLQRQRGFFENGLSHLRPLTMGQVAEDIGVHETTVSRAIAAKYIQTPHGLFPFKVLFTTGYQADDGEALASVVIKQKLQELVDGEETKKPLSDDKLAQMLKDEGLNVARRTVAKYREELGIPASHMRRRF